MNVNPALFAELHKLTAALDLPDAELPRSVQLLEDSAALAIRSLVGWKLTLAIDGQDIALTWVQPWVETADIQASLRLPASELAADLDGHLVFYATRPGAFRLKDQGTPDPDVAERGLCVDSDLPCDIVPGLSGIAELSLINRAIGVLIGRGETADDAREQLRARAAAAHISVSQSAELLLQENQNRRN